MLLYYDPIYTNAIDPTARFPRDRYRLIAERLEGRTDVEMRRPRLATREEIILAHDSRYVERFLDGALSYEEIRRIGLRPWTPSIVERTLRLTGGSLQALEHVIAHGGMAGNMAGGTHHAHYDFGSGYCIFNDLAICAQAALKRPEIQRVLVLDLDVHQGDGTASICQSWPEVFTCSIHSQSNFPFRKTQSDLDVPLADGMEDEAYLEHLERTLNLIRPEEFDLILYQAGVDALAADALGNLKLTREGMDRRNRRVFEIHKQHGVPVVLFMGGGYANPIGPTVDAFADLFTVAAEYSMPSDAPEIPHG
ncbi:histone deacetylase family protein [Haloferula sp.]|uniref:histone deacetylase family protein n=1 Tax=Haloferula sp. TaxID=2497595 RepID=UPI003C739FD4